MNLSNSKITILSLQNSKIISHKLSKNNSEIGSDDESDLIIPSLKSKGFNPFKNLKNLSTQRNQKIKIGRPQSSYVPRNKMANIFDESPTQKELKNKNFYIAKKYINYNIIKKPDDIYKIYEPLITTYKNIVKNYYNDIVNDKKRINNLKFYRNHTLENILLRTKQIERCPLKNSYINNVNNSCIAFRDMFTDQNKKSLSKNEGVYCLKKIKRNNFRRYSTKQKKNKKTVKIFERKEKNSSKKALTKIFKKDYYERKNLIYKKSNMGEIKVKSRNMGTNVNFDEITKKKFVYHNNVKMKTFLDLSQYKKKE